MLRAIRQRCRRRPAHAADPESIWLSTRIVYPVANVDILNSINKNNA